MAKHRKTGARLALAAGASIAILGGSAGMASAAPPNYGDAAIDQNAPTFRLNPDTLEPGCFQLGRGQDHLGVDVDSHIDVTQRVLEAHIRVLPGANFSIDQALVPGWGTGYKVYDKFDTGSISNDPDIDPYQEATDLAAPDGDHVDHSGTIVCVSDHPDGDQNEPYIENGLPGEVAAINRPIIQPTISSLGMSVLSARDTYKVGFGYEVQRGYDSHWRKLFLNDWVWGPGTSFGDPQAWDANGDQALDHLFVFARPEQAGVSRYNDIDEFGEEYNSGTEKSSYGQPILFDVSGKGDPHAYAHKSLPGVVNGGFGPWDSFIEAAADQTNSAGLHTFSAEGDLPLSWAVKPSLAPDYHGKKVTLTDDQFRAWDKSWQDYYVGKGPKPTLPLAPGTKSPDPDPNHTVIVNNQIRVDDSGKTIIVPLPNPGPTPSPGPVPCAKKCSPPVKATVTARLMGSKNNRYVRVFVKSDAKKARVVLRMLNGNRRTVKMAMKSVATNQNVRVSGLRIGKEVRSVKAVLAG